MDQLPEEIASSISILLRQRPLRIVSKKYVRVGNILCKRVVVLEKNKFDMVSMLLRMRVRLLRKIMSNIFVNEMFVCPLLILLTIDGPRHNRSPF